MHRIVDTPLWDTKPTLKEQFGYHPKLAISARAVAEVELELIQSRKYKGGTVYEISALGGRKIPTFFITPPGYDPKNPKQGQILKRDDTGSNDPIWRILAAERNAKL